MNTLAFTPALNVQLRPANHKPHFSPSLDPTNHKRPLSKAANAPLLSTRYRHSHGVEELMEDDQGKRGRQGRFGVETVNQTF